MSSFTATTLLNRLLARGKLRHLQVLMKLAELGSVQRTADSVGMTQSGVTQTLAYLESLLGTRLFIRHARGVLPTAATVELLPTVRQLMQGVAQGAEVLAAAQQQGRQSLRLLASGAAIHGLLIPCLSSFVARHPDIRLELAEAENDDLLLAMTRHEVDLVVCRRPAAIPNGWEFEELMPDRFTVVAAPGDPLLRRKAVDWGQLAARTWLMSSVSTQARQRFEALCDGWEDGPDYFPVVTRVLSVALHLVREHRLLGFMPHAFLRPQIEAGQLGEVRLAMDLPMAPIGLMRPALDTRESAQRFGQFLAAAAGR